MSTKLRFSLQNRLKQSMRSSSLTWREVLAMADERKQIIEELTKEVEGINNIAMIRFILGVVRSLKKKWGAI